MRACAAGFLAAALILPPCAALSETEVAASFESPATPSEYQGDWPVWTRMRVEITRTAGSDEGIARGSTTFTWYVDADEDGFFLGNGPVLADVNGDGRSDIVAVQYLPSSGWRMGAFEPPSPALGGLGGAPFSAGVDQAVLLGVIDGGSDDGSDTGALIGVVVREQGKSRLLIYSFEDDAAVTLGPYHGYNAGPAGPAPRVRHCQDQRAFLLASDDDATVVAIGRRGDSDTLRVWTSPLPATDAGFAKAASCD